jgi:hypothetical protein
MEHPKICFSPGGFVSRKMPYLAACQSSIQSRHGDGTYEGSNFGAQTMAMLSGIITW